MLAEMHMILVFFFTPPLTLQVQNQFSSNVYITKLEFYF